MLPAQPIRMTFHKLCLMVRRFSILSILVFYFSLQSASAGTPQWVSRAKEEKRSLTPFHQPQTNFVFGQSSQKLTVFSQGVSQTVDLDKGGMLSTFGFDIETNHSRFFNIGFYARYNRAVGTRPQMSGIYFFNNNEITETSCTLGGFLRAFYAPAFLISQSAATNVFARLNLGGGPVMLPANLTAFTGFLAQSSVNVGIETYFNRWLGLGLSYGLNYELGTVTFGDSGNFRSQGSEALVSVKTTLF